MQLIYLLKIVLKIEAVTGKSMVSVNIETGLLIKAKPPFVTKGIEL